MSKIDSSWPIFTDSLQNCHQEPPLRFRALRFHYIIFSVTLSLISFFFFLYRWFTVNTCLMHTGFDSVLTWIYVIFSFFRLVWYSPWTSKLFLSSLSVQWHMPCRLFNGGLQILLPKTVVRRCKFRPSDKIKHVWDCSFLRLQILKVLKVWWSNNGFFIRMKCNGRFCVNWGESQFVEVNTCMWAVRLMIGGRQTHIHACT